jgi:putative ABC transport system substrate-binding protein
MIGGNPIHRRSFLTLLGTSAAAWPLAARAQQPPMPVIGVLEFAANNPEVSTVRAFRQGLADAGFMVGRNVAIESRPINDGRLKESVADLVDRQVAVILAGGGSATAALAAKEATSTIPIVFAMGANPVTSGLVASLSRPGGNVTGVTFLSTELGSKRLALLHDLVPQATKIAYLTSGPAGIPGNEQMEDILSAALVLKQEVLTFNCSAVSDFLPAFASMMESGVGAMIVRALPFLLGNRRRVIDLAARYKIPAMYPSTVYTRDGGLISYSADVEAGFRLAGSQYVARILRGAKPADLPVQQPTRFELLVNLNTAKALGLTVPVTLLTIADEVIE